MKENRMMRLACMMFAFVVWTAFAATEREYIWPDGKMPDAQPHQIAAMTDVSEKPAFKPDDWRRPYIEWCEAPTAGKTDVCMILISGGSYNRCCDVGLIEKWRKRLTEPVSPRP